MNRRTAGVLLCCAVVSVPIAAASMLTGSREAKPTLKRLLRLDMTKPGAVRPHGVPASYDWARRPRVKRKAPPSAFRAATAWGHLYRCARSRPSRRAVEIRGLQLWVLLRGERRWRRLQYASDVHGRSFPEDYHGGSIAPDLVGRNLSETTVRLQPGYNFHFWPSPRAVLPGGVRAVTTIVRARFAVRGRPRHNPCVAVAAGSDYWRTPTVTAGGRRNVTDAAIGRFKRVGNRWRLFTATTASRQELRKSSLPAHFRRSLLH
jgi:hypothetical protein